MNILTEIKSKLTRATDRVLRGSGPYFFSLARRNISNIEDNAEVREIVHELSDAFSNGVFSEDQDLPDFLKRKSETSLSDFLYRFKTNQKIYGYSIVYFRGYSDAGKIEDIADVDVFDGQYLDVTWKSLSPYQVDYSYELISKIVYRANKTTFAPPLDSLLVVYDDGVSSHDDLMSRAERLGKDKVRLIDLCDGGEQRTLNRAGMYIISPKFRPSDRRGFSPGGLNDEDLNLRSLEGHTVQDKDIVEVGKPVSVSSLQYDVRQLGTEFIRKTAKNVLSNQHGVPPELLAQNDAKYSNLQIIYKKYYQGTIEKQARDLTDRINAFLGIDISLSYVHMYADEEIPA